MNELIQQLERSEAYLAADPTNQELLARVIDLSLAAGQHERAAHHVEAALARYPRDAYFQARQGALYLASQRWGEAESVFKDLLGRHADINLAYNLAYAYLGQGCYAEAVQALSAFLDAPALTPPMATLLVRALHQQGKGDRAIALAQVHMEGCRGDAEFLAAVSLACLDSGDLEQAEQLSAAAAALGEQHGAIPLETLVVGGSLALARADSEAAIVRFQQALAQRPREGRSWSGLGTASLLKRDLPAAQQQLEQAVALMPGHIGSWHLLGWSRLLDRQLAPARAAFETALVLDRNFGESHGGMAVVLALQGERDAAQAAIERALGLDQEGLAARYAQMILSGQTDDPVRFRALAGRLLSSRQGAFGQNMGELLQSYEAEQ